MEELVTVALDAMGGDNSPSEIVKGGVDAVNASKEVKVLMVGDREKIQAELEKYTYDKERIEIIPATEIISIMNRRSSDSEQTGFFNCPLSETGEEW